VGTWLKFYFVGRLVLDGKLSIRKILNLIRVKVYYHLKLNKTSPYPAVLMVEPTNQCQLRCTKCRTPDNSIFDYAFEGRPGSIPIGKIDFPVFKKTIDAFHKHLMVASLYMNGEPFLLKDIYKMVQYCTDKKLATLVGTNGMLCGGKYADKIVESGMDIIKIAVSGFRQETYEKYHVEGDIELIKSNLADLSEAKKRHNSNLIIHVEYIIFEYNGDEFREFKEYCQNIEVLCTRRWDSRVFSLEYSQSLERDQTSGSESQMDESVEGSYSKRLCDYLWGVMALNHDGTIIPCCQFSQSSKPIVMGSVSSEKPITDIQKIWNNNNFLDFRKKHVTGGRAINSVCSTCQMEGLGLQSSGRKLQ
jgi:radical SAM protein with 4Fe4S-binding SPASM domain